MTVEDLVIPLLFTAIGILGGLMGLLYKALTDRCARFDQRLDDLTTYTRHEVRDIKGAHHELIREVLVEQRKNIGSILDSLSKINRD